MTATTCEEISGPPKRASKAAPGVNPLLEAALQYAAQGWRVFPCKPCDKTPRTRHGYKDATVNAAAIRKWWRGTRHDSNVAIATGDGLVVVDIDGPEGEAAIAGRDLPRAPTAITGRGRHLYFTDLTGTLATDHSAIPDVHVQAAGAYVIAAPSVHPSGAIYSWAPGLSPDDLVPPPAPEWLYEVLSRGRIPPATPEVDPRRNVIPQGKRNDTLTSLAGSLHADGAGADAILAQLLEVNADRCRPPLPEAEVRRVVASVSRYKAGARGPTVRVGRRLLRQLDDGPLVLYAVRQAMTQATGAVPRQKQLAAALGVSVRSVQRWAAHLAVAGLEQYERPRRLFVCVPVALLTDPAVPAGAKVLALHLDAAAAGNDRTATVGQAALARATGQDQRTVRRHLQALLERQHLLVLGAAFDPALGRRVRCNRYRLLCRGWPAVVGQTAPSTTQVSYSDQAGRTDTTQMSRVSKPLGVKGEDDIVVDFDPRGPSTKPTDLRSPVVETAAATGPNCGSSPLSAGDLAAAKTLATALALPIAYMVAMVRQHGLAEVQAQLGCVGSPPKRHRGGHSSRRP